MRKRIITLVWIMTIVFTLSHHVVFSMSANDTSVQLKQPVDGDSKCTFTSCLNMFRRRAIIDGLPDWANITHSNYSNTITSGGKSVRWEITDVKGMNASVVSIKNKSISEKKEYFISMLSQHPEGIVIYCGSSPMHTVLLTDYTNGIFYCWETMNDYPWGRIPLTSTYIANYQGLSQDSTIAKISQIWYITNKSGGTLDSHKHNYDLATETCKSCGEKFTRKYTDINKTYKVINNNVSIKSEPYKDIGKVYTRLDGGTKVTVKRSFENVYGNKWYEVSYGKYTGYMYSGNLEEVKEKSASTLKIDLTDYPTSIKVGSGYGLRGTVSSNYSLKQVNGYIKQGNSVVQSSKDTPDGKSMDVRTANLNNNLLFNRLSAGNYKLVVEAIDTSGKQLTVSKDFNVYAEQTKVSSSLSINLEKYPVTLDQGSAYGLRGSVTSNYNISVVRGYVNNSSGKTILSSTDNPNSTYMDIRTANLNDKLIFNNLSAGSYTMIVEAKDTSGRVVTAKKDFIVQAKGGSSGGSASGTAVTGTVNIPSSWDNLSIRSGPSTSYTIVGSMNQGVKCTVYPDKTSNGWYYVNYNGIWGYASGNQITLGSSSGSGTSSSNTRVGIVNIPASWDNLSIRSGPGTSYDIIGSMNQGAKCTVYPDKASNGWYYVSYNGVTGYASGNQINLQ